MFRPSRPMIRPFRSSLGSCTTETVVSAVWLEAVRWIATERMLRARRSASTFASSSIWRTSLAMSWRVSSSTLTSSASRACWAVSPATRSSSASCWSRSVFRSSCICLACASRSAIDWSRRLSSSSRSCSCSSFARTRSSILTRSERRSLRICSCSARWCSSSSRAATLASLSWLSARLSASLRIRSAWRSASASRPTARRVRTAYPMAMPTTSASTPISACVISSSFVRTARGDRERRMSSSGPVRARDSPASAAHHPARPSGRLSIGDESLHERH